MSNLVQAVKNNDVDIQVSTAKAYPRDLEAAKKRAMQLATGSVATAESCIYALPRDGKTIHGPSARLSEILAHAWGNMHIGGRVNREEHANIVAEGAAWDLENNVRSVQEVKRRITYSDRGPKKGARFNDDMITMTGNAAISIATRNAILKVIPKVFWEDVYDAVCKKALNTQSAAADSKGAPAKVSVKAKRDELINQFGAWGIAPEQILEKFNRPNLDAMTRDDVLGLISFHASVNNGELTVDEIFKSQPAQASELTYDDIEGQNQ